MKHPDTFLDMDDEMIAIWKERVDKLSHEEMARLWRFAEPGSTPYFRNGHPVADYFQQRFYAFGGFTASVSKAIGWER